MAKRTSYKNFKAKCSRNFTSMLGSSPKGAIFHSLQQREGNLVHKLIYSVQYQLFSAWSQPKYNQVLLAQFLLHSSRSNLMHIQGMDKEFFPP